MYFFKIFIILLFSGFRVFFTNAQNKEITISGFIKDSATAETLPGAHIIVAQRNTITNLNGYFSLKIEKADTLVLLVQSFGYSTKKINLNTIADTNIIINLEKLIFGLAEVVITEKPQLIKSNEQLQINLTEVRKMPFVFGEADAFKALLLLPGVVSTFENNVSLSVRGGNADQTITVFEGATVYNPMHLLGFFSSFNTSALKSLTLYHGHIPLRYGNAASALMEIEMKEGNNQKLKIDAGIGLISSDFMINGPINKSKKLKVTAGFRTSYLDKIMKVMGSGSEIDMGFYDLNFKSTYEFSSGKKLSLVFYKSFDEINLNPFEFVPIKNYSQWQNNLFSARYQNIINKKIHSSTTVSYSNLNVLNTDQINSYTVNFRNNINDFSINQHFDIFSSHKHTFRTGINLSAIILEPANYKRLRDTLSINFIPQTQNGFISAVYFDDEWNIKPRIKLNSGLRFSSFKRLDENAAWFLLPEPRFKINYTFKNDNVISLSASRNVQYTQLISNTLVILPLNFWALSSNKLKPQICNAANITFTAPLPKNWNLTNSIYFKKLQNLVDIKDNTDFFVDNDFENGLNTGKGSSYGFEFLLQKQESNFNFFTSYTYGRSFRTIHGVNNSERFRAPFDFPHSLNVFGSFNRKKWNFSLNFTLQSGRVITAPLYQDIYGLIVFSDRNGYRLPNHHRLDFNATFYPHKHGVKTRSSWIFSVYNLYNQKNIHSIIFTDTDRAITLFPIIPSVSYRYTMF